MKNKNWLMCKILCFVTITSVKGTILPNTDPCDFYQSVNITGGTLTLSGSVLFEGQEYVKGSYGIFKDNLASEDADNESVHLRGCFCHLKSSKPCLPLCCPVGYIKRLHINSPCYPYAFDAFVNTSNTKDRKLIKIQDKYRIIQRDLCSTHNFYHIKDKVEWKLLENGTFYVEEFENDRYTIHTNYCVDPILNEDFSITTKIAYCFDFVGFGQLRFYSVYKNPFYGMTFSIAFLIITLMIYAFLPDLRNLRGKLLMCYMASLIFFYAFVLIDYYELLLESTLPCNLVGFMTYGSLLMAIFFLNTINFDYYSTFYIKDFRVANKSNLFRWYVLYSVGATLILVFVAAILDSMEVIRGQPRSGVGPYECFFNSRLGESFYFYTIILVTVLLNTILFLMTGCKMRSIRKARTMAKDDRREYNKSLERETFCHLFLMFLTIDFFWLIELLVWTLIFGEAHDVLGFIIYSQGFWIFVLCILKRSSFDKILNRFAHF